MQWMEVSLQTTHEQADTMPIFYTGAGAQGVAWKTRF